jgi:adenylate kinase
MSEAGGFVVEGFPRTIAQYIALRMWGTMPVYLWMNLGEAECLERLVLRARDDDTPDAIAKRLETFRDETIPILKLLQEADQVEVLTASVEVESVQAMAECALERHV